MVNLAGLRLQEWINVCLSCKGLDEQQSVQIFQCYLQEDYRGTRNTLKVSPASNGTHTYI